MKMKLPTRELSDFKLRVGLWFVRERMFFKKLFIVFLIILNFSLYGYSFYKSVNLLILQNDTYNEMLNQLGESYIDFNYWREKQKAKDIMISEIVSLPSSENKKDLVVKAVNPNDNFFISRILFQFFAGDAMIYEGESFLYPKEQQYLVAYGIPSENLTSVTFAIKEISFSRVHLDFENFVNKRRAFKIDNMQYIPSNELPNTGTLAISQTRFRITNESTFSYKLVDINIALYSSESVVAVSTTKIKNFNSQDSHDVVINWLAPIPGVSRMEILPHINVLDENIYLEYVVEPGERK